MSMICTLRLGTNMTEVISMKMAAQDTNTIGFRLLIKQATAVSTEKVSAIRIRVWNELVPKMVTTPLSADRHMSPP